MIKLCKQCGFTSDFPKWLLGNTCHECTKENKRAYYRAKPEHYRALTSAYAKANPDKLKAYNARTKEYRRWRVIEKKYGINQKDFDAMFDAQGKCCALCKTPEPNAGRFGWQIDHCHDSGKVRGILCHNCNVGLGNLRHNPRLMRTAAEYIERHQL
jgi:hypothetical protein